jgi:uncharacterized protein YkwD
LGVTSEHDGSGFSEFQLAVSTRPGSGNLRSEAGVHPHALTSISEVVFSDKGPDSSEMKTKTLAGWMIVSSLILISCASHPGSGKPEKEPVAKRSADSTVEETLIASLNDKRQKAGKPALVVSSRLSQLAREDSDAGAATGRLPDNNTGRLQSRSFFEILGKLQASMDDRGPKTGEDFVEVWSKGKEGLITDDWNKMGVGISRSASGQVYAVVLLGRMSGEGALMQPALSPGGFIRR